MYWKVFSYQRVNAAEMEVCCNVSLARVLY